MVRSNPSGLINSSRQIVESRVTISQLTWLAAIGVASVVGVLLGAPAYLGFIAFLVALFPVASWALGRSALALSEQAKGNLVIFSWVLVTFAGLAIGGGIMSPLIVVLLLGPFSAVAQARVNVALEILVLGFLAFGASISAGALGWSDTVPANWHPLIVPLAFAVIFQLGVMFWASTPSSGHARLAANDSSRVDNSGPANAGDKDVGEFDQGLPILLIHATDQGRIRAVHGPQELRWEGLGIGRELGFLEERHDGDMVSSPSGDMFRVVEADNPTGGRWISLVPERLMAAPVGRADTQDTQARLQKAEAALVERTNFFAGLGHDLKTPLNAIIGFSELMKEEVRGPLPEPYKEYPAIIHESGQDLMLLVDDMLDLAKSEAKAHRLDLEPVDLVASGQSVGHQLADQAERAGILLRLPDAGPIWAKADARAVRQIWQNLVSNAIKYSETGGRVTLSAKTLGGAVAISVRDEGAGMSKADLDRIAKPFAQGENAKGRAGTGLGLAVVHRFAQLHGGQVMIDTQENKGTRVQVTLPKLDEGSVEITQDTIG
jgi:cell cycle sensor histidine kinase DivJ